MQRSPVRHLLKVVFVILAASLNAPVAGAAETSPQHGQKIHAKKHHSKKSMHAEHHGSMAAHHKRHMAMMKKHGGMQGAHHGAMMEKMHAQHHGGMKGQKMAMHAAMMKGNHGGMTGHASHMAPMKEKKPGTCGVNMYWKTGKCHDAREKK